MTPAPELPPAATGTPPTAAGGAPRTHVERHTCPDCRCPERAAATCPHDVCGHLKWFHDDTKRGRCSVQHGPKATPCPCPGLHVTPGEA